MIPYGRQSIDEDDVAAVADVLRGDWLTTGPAIGALEDAIAERVEARFAVAFTSGTAALHGAAATAGLGPGDLVYTSPLTFMASANCARYVGATPALIDIDPQTWNLDTTAVPDDADGLVAVHYAGLPIDLESLSRRPRVVIEDAAHSLGAHTPNGPVGNCAHSDMTCFSLHPVKPITTGEGGLVTTNDSQLAEALRRFRNHGIEQKPEEGGWYYEIATEGFNYRLTDIQAALGLSQLEKLGWFIERRNQIAQRYRDLLVETSVGLPPRAPEGYLHGYHLFPVLVEDRRRVFDAMRSAGFGVQVHYVPIHHHPISKDIGAKTGDYPVCDRVYDRLISLPMYPALTDAEQDRVVDSLHKLARLSSR